MRNCNFYSTWNKWSSGPTAPPSQSTKSSDKFSYCRLCYWQFHRASKCPEVPTQPRGEIINARVTRPKRVLERQQWNHKPHTHYKGLRTPKKPHSQPSGCLVQYKKSLQHCPYDQKTGARTKHYRKTSCGRFSSGKFCKEWLPPKESGGKRDKRTQEFLTRWNVVYRKRHSRIMRQN